jgi:hypothetical protein
MKRIKPPSPPGLKVETIDRDGGLKQTKDLAEGRVGLTVVVSSPEDCGRNSWLKQPL